jgi:hypothetical protein
MGDPRPCLVCNRQQDDPLHGPEAGGLAHDIEPRIEHHPYDPGERRQLVRRMDDRIQRVEDAFKRSS